jgi:TonB family protein
MPDWVAGRFLMRYLFVFGIAVLTCSGVLSGAQSHVNLSDAEKALTTTTSATALESLPKVCSQTNPPPCATAPRAVSAPPAEVSQQAGGQAGGKRKKGVSVLSVIVEPDGSTSHIRVIKRVGLGLDEKAIEAVKTWKFKPATLNGKPVAVQIAVEVKFHLY